jgi:hypothetical protein
MKITLAAISGSFGDFFFGLSTPYSGSTVPAAQRPTEKRRKEIEALMGNFGIYYA